MPPELEKKEIKSYPKGLVLLLSLIVTIGAIIFFRPSFFPNALKELSQTNSKDFLEALHRQISNSGKLIFSGENSNSFLTYEGVFNDTNEERENFKLDTLRRNSSLNLIAKRRLDDMFANQYFEHVSPEGRSASIEAEVVGYEFITIGENIALGDFADDQALVTAWMNSPGHRANILGKQFNELGVAVGRAKYEGKETWIAVQIFGRPLSDCPLVDGVLKAEVSKLSDQIEINQRELDRRQAELETYSRDQRENPNEYNKKVEEFNTLARETNHLLENIKIKIEIYNKSVRDFNSCLETVS